MIGSSWGGFNALQIAALRPPALAAIVTNCSTDDRYTDDMHYMGGCLLNDTLDWGSSFFARLPRPPDPEISGPDWRRKWQARLEQLRPAARRLARATSAATATGSTARSTRTTPRSSARSSPPAAGWTATRTPSPGCSRTSRVPRLGLIGAWGHKYGHQAVPGPAIGYLQECLRWFDHWLRGRDTGIMREPMLRAFMQEEVPPTGDYPVCPGRWVAEPVWPPPRGHGAGGSTSTRAARLRPASRPRRDAHPPVGADDRRRRRRVVSARHRRLRPAVPDRSAGGRRAEPRVRHRAARAGRSRSWASRR